MVQIITISVSEADAHELDQLNISPSKLFRSAMALERSKTEFLDVYDILDYRRALRQVPEKFLNLQKEIANRQEIIDSLRDVLAEKELAEQRRIRKTEQPSNGTCSGS